VHEVGEDEDEVEDVRSAENQDTSKTRPRKKGRSVKMSNEDSM